MPGRRYSIGNAELLLPAAPLLRPVRQLLRKDDAGLHPEDALQVGTL